VDLVSGWKWAGDLSGCVTTIHEATRQECYGQRVVLVSGE
jgi:hypothetical protein